jgi:hypothetical protein
MLPELTYMSGRRPALTGFSRTIEPGRIEAKRVETEYLFIERAIAGELPDHLEGDEAMGMKMIAGGTPTPLLLTAT